MKQRGAYYNEFDEHKALWLKELMKRGLIAEGDIDTRSIELVQPADVAGYERVHWFAGVGIWDYALTLAGWTGPVWTASCPCQPFSAAGKRKGTEDSRHLWPVLARLIRLGRPAAIFGEQVSSKDGLAWFGNVRLDLEAAEYRAWALDTCAAGVGAPHIRQRLYWAARLADAEREQRQRGRAGEAGGQPGPVERAERLRDAGAVATDGDCGAVRLEHDASDGRQQRRAEPSGRSAPGGCGAVRVGDVQGERRGRRAHDDDGRRGECPSVDPGPVNGYWRGADWVLTRPQRLGDAPSLRPVEPTFGALDDGAAAGMVRGGYNRFPLSQGEEARVLRLKGYGDGIVATQAAAFIQACAEEWGLQ